ncbi:MAG: branched-chain amino acid ABC transporter permease [Euzebya sp.]
MSPIGKDEWVAQAEERTERGSGRLGLLQRRWEQVPATARFGAVIAAAALLPLLSDSTFVVRVGLNGLLFALLALGLNVVVGYAGLLDLGFIAFYGMGAYTYALLSSDQLGLHWPTELAVLTAVLATVALGYLLGLPSRRLLGDYLAIVTLFFGQAFVQLVTNVDRLPLPGGRTLDLTGGPNGITGVDQFRIGWIHLQSVQDYYWLLIVMFTLGTIVFTNANNSRTGRAWRAVREDPLAAAAMTIPVNRLKLLAFAVGAGTAGLAGTVFAAVQLGVFPANFTVTLLIMVYAAVVLGGTGSIPGVILGAAVISIVPEILRDPDLARLLFYGVMVVTLLVVLRPWRVLAAILTGTVLFGFAIRLAVGALWSDALSPAAGGGIVARALEAWVVTIPDQVLLANTAFVVLIAAGLTLTRVRPTVRRLALPPVLYLAAFVWENRLVTDPSVTRQLLLGVILVVMMNVRPQGLLGKPRVEIL